MTYQPSADRYEGIKYRYTGRSGLKLPEISFGLWHNFGHNAPSERAREMCRTAFDHGITHFDLANNYGPPPGSAEEHVRRHPRHRFPQLPGRTGDLDQGRLPHVAGPLRRMGQPQVSLVEPRPEPQAHEARLCRHLLLASGRSQHAARRDDGRARHRGPAGEGALCGHLLLQREADRPGRQRSCAISARRA